MDVREKLVKLLKTQFYDEYEFEEIADWLIAHGVTVQDWIPVTDRMPEIGQKCLIANREIVVRGWLRPDGVWKTGVSSDEIWIKFSLYQPTHWMPMPQLPKGE